VTESTAKRQLQSATVSRRRKKSGISETFVREFPPNQAARQTLGGAGADVKSGVTATERAHFAAADRRRRRGRTRSGDVAAALHFSRLSRLRHASAVRSHQGDS
jgi:hypothetical protein